MQRLLLATNNAGKVADIELLIAPSGWTAVTPAALDLRLDPEETAGTYTGNAAIKALAFARAAGLPALADDSGLEVDALGGRPGVLSGRYGGTETSSAGKIRLLLAELAGVPDAARTARFRSAVVVALPDGRTWTGEGSCEGRITTSPRGVAGFGYDPVFVPTRPDGQTALDDAELTFAELTAEKKNQISHRAAAIRAVLPVLAMLAQHGQTG